MDEYRGRRPVAGAGLAGLLGVLVGFAAPVVAMADALRTDYRIGAGDVVEVIVSGGLEFNHRTPVQLDGSISLPIVGTLFVGGTTPTEVRTSIQAALSTRVIMQKRSDGRDVPIMIKPEEVSAAVVEYRPVFVNGDVARPGEQAFRPGMTVRHLLAASGGRGEDATTSSLHNLNTLNADFASLSAEYVSLQVESWRLRHDLGNTADFDRSLLKQVPLAQVDVGRLIELARQNIDMRSDARSNEITYLKKAISEANQQIGILRVQLEKEREGTRADLADLERVSALLKKGALAMPRVTETRRALLLSSTRELQTSAQLSGIVRQRDDLERRLQQIDSERMVEASQKLQDSAMKIGGIEGRLKTLAATLEQLSVGFRWRQTRGAPRITIYRAGESGSTVDIPADVGTPVLPGDVVEILADGVAVVGDGSTMARRGVGTVQTR